MSVFTGKHLILGVTGGIAAYKAAELIRLLKRQGARVTVVMTQSAQQFITPLTLASLSGQAVLDDLWQNRADEQTNISHINLTRTADALIIAPCTANFMHKIAHGVADDLLSNLVLARNQDQCPLAIAPAMNLEMWRNPATIRNLAQIQNDGIRIIGPAEGEQACGEVGLGRMSEAPTIVDAIEALLTPPVLAGKKVLITAGATFEPIDPVRGITNHSSGKMGYALAHAAVCAGAQVTLISGKTDLATPTDAKRIDIQTADELLSAVQQHLQGTDIFISVAAVADWKPAQVATQKLKKTNDTDVPTLTFVQTPDILATIAARADAPFCVGFAAESENVVAYAQAKRARKNIPLIIANSGPATFGSDTNQVTLITEHSIEPLPHLPKHELAHQLISRIASLATVATEPGAPPPAQN